MDENQSNEKRQSQAAENLAPEWARGLINELDTLSINVNAIKIDIGELKHNFFQTGRQNMRYRDSVR